jgi:type II secretion system protein G
MGYKDAEVACMSLRLRARARRGFTLIELLVVVVIIGILASIALPSFVSAQDKARNASVVANVNVVRAAVENFSADHNGVPPTLAQAVGKVKEPEDSLVDGGYLVGNALPPAPWCPTKQARPVVGFEGSETMPTMQLLEDKELTLPQGGARFNPPLTGAVPTDASYEVFNYGAISYDTVTDSAKYVIFGTGKRNGEAIIGASCSNGG